MRCKHQDLRLSYGCIAQRHVHRHLVTIEIRIERRTNKWVKLNCLSFDQFRLERLYRQTVKRWGAVKHDRMPLQYVFKNIPNNRFFALNQFLGALHCLYNTSFNKLADNEWFEQFRSHILRQTALVQFHFRTYHDNRTTGIVNTLTQQVLTETALFTLQYVRK